MPLTRRANQLAERRKRTLLSSFRRGDTSGYGKPCRNRWHSTSTLQSPSQASSLLISCPWRRRFARQSRVATEASAPIGFTTRSAKMLRVESPVTVGLGLNSACDGGGTRTTSSILPTGMSSILGAATVTLETRVHAHLRVKPCEPTLPKTRCRKW